LNLPSPDKIIAIEIDKSISLSLAPEAAQDRKMAIQDLLEFNVFKLSTALTGPYHLHLTSLDSRLIFNLRGHADKTFAIGLALSPFRRIVKDYFQICDSYNLAVQASSPQGLETIDMARRAIHNDGSKLLQARMAGKVEMDFDTARRLFTLVCALLWRSA
jgi:uncharacterized protein (UPF0262 family)